MPAAEEGAEKTERKEDEEPPEEGMVQSRSSSRKSNASIDDSKPIGDESRSAPTAVSNGDDVDQRNDLGIEEFRTTTWKCPMATTTARCPVAKNPRPSSKKMF